MQLGSFKDSLTEAEIIHLYSLGQHELLGPCLRRANLYFEFQDLLLGIYQKGRNWFVLGDVLKIKDLEGVQFGIQREGLFQALYHFSAQNSKSVLGYYLEYPISFREFQCVPVGLCYDAALAPEFKVGNDAEEIRRALNLAIRKEGLRFKKAYFHELSEHQKANLKSRYQQFLSRKIKPLIGFLLAKRADRILDREFFYYVVKEDEILAFVSGFELKKSFYLDRLVRFSKERMLLDMLVGKCLEDQFKKGRSKVHFGLCAFYGEPRWFWHYFRKIVRFWYDSSRLRQFKRKYAKDEKRVYYFVEKRKNHFYEFLKLSFISLYLR